MPPSYIPSTKIAATRAAAVEARAAAERLIQLCDAADASNAGWDASWRASHAALADAIAKPTARQMLEPWGLDRIDTSGVYENWLDIPVKSFGFVTSREQADRGGVFCYCAGKCIMAITLDNVPRTTLYLVLDDSDAKAWHCRRRDIEQSAATSAIAYAEQSALGPCPSDRLRLVIAA